MRRMFIALAAFAGALIAAPAWAQAPAGFELFYNGPTDVNMGGRPVVANIALYADKAAAKNNNLRMALVVDVTEFIEQTEQDLENWVAARQDRCGQRWGASEPLIEFPQGAIRFAIDLELEVWNCGFDGKGEPGRLAREAGSVDVTLKPYVADGKLQASLGSFAIDNRSGVSKYLPLEFVVRQILDGELKKLNENAKFWRAPKPFVGEKFTYESIVAKRKPDGHVVITAIYKAKGPAGVFKRVAEKVRTEGIVSERD